MCDSGQNSCCETITRTLGTFELQISDIAARGRNAIITAGFTGTIAEGRNALLTAGLNGVTSQFRNAINRLIILNQSTDNSCCQSAAFAIRDTSIGIANQIIAAVADPNIPLATTNPAPTFNLAFVLGNLVGNMAFPTTTIGLPSPAVNGSLFDALAIIFNTIINNVNGNCNGKNSENNVCEPCVSTKIGKKGCRPCKQ